MMSSPSFRIIRTSIRQGLHTFPLEAGLPAGPVRGWLLVEGLTPATAHLARQLNTDGWATLRLDLPVAQPLAFSLVDGAIKRVLAALKWAKQHQLTRETPLGFLMGGAACPHLIRAIAHPAISVRYSIVYRPDFDSRPTPTPSVSTPTLLCTPVLSTEAEQQLQRTARRFFRGVLKTVALPGLEEEQPLTQATQTALARLVQPWMQQHKVVTQVPSAPPALHRPATWQQQVTTARLALSLGASMLLAQPAQAQTSSVTDNVLTVNGTNSGDTITITCSGGNLKVNGSDPGSGAVLCNSLTGMTLNGADGDDTLLVSPTSADLPSITIINFDGGADNDLMTGSSDIPGSLVGGAGNDTLIGGSANDVFNGGTGVDVFRGTNDGNFTGTLSNTVTLVTGLGTDSLSNIDQLEITGGASANSFNFEQLTNAVLVSGLGGNDTMLGGASNDSLNGGSGVDVFQDTNDGNFTGTLSNTVTLVTGRGTDSLSNVDLLEITGGGSANSFNFEQLTNAVLVSGLGGNDTLVGGSANDSFNGGPGIDVFQGTNDGNFSATQTNAVTLVTGLGTDSLSNVDQLVIIGGAGANNLDFSGLTNAVVLNGRGGNDTLVGGGAPDTFIFFAGEGIDNATGGLGTDLGILDGTLLTTNAPFGLHFISQDFLGAGGCDAFEFNTNTGLKMNGVEQASIIGSGGNDQLFWEDDCRSQDGMTGLSVNGGGGDDTLFLRGNNSGNELGVTNTAFVFNGVSGNLATDLEQINVQGFPSFNPSTNSGNDTFTFGQPPSVPYVLNGGSPTGGSMAEGFAAKSAMTGDQLTIDAAGQTATDTGSQVQFGTGQTISYSGVETVSITNTLPVELTTFDAILENDDVTLHWTTASETQNTGFDIEHAYLPDGITGVETWETLGFQEGAGTTTTPQTYSFRVSDLLPGKHVFRLRQVDFDGAFQYSPTIEVTIELATAFSVSAVYPNPFTTETQFTLGVQEAQQVTIEVFDMLGRRVARLHDGVLAGNQTHRFVVQAPDWPSGLYTCRIVGDTFNATRQVLLVK